MRKIIAIGLIPVIIFFTIYACKKGEVISDYNSLKTGSYVKLVKAGNAIINYSNLAGSTVDVTVSEYGDPIDKIKVYVTKGGTSLDKTNWKAIKEFAYSGETNLAVTATEIAAALGIPPADLETGATYTLYNELITKDGETYDIANTNGGFAGNTNYNMAMTWTAVVVCPFSPAGFTGNFEVLQDDWADFNPGDVVSVTSAGNDSIVLAAYPNPNPPANGTNKKPITVKINAATGAATVASQTYGDYPGFDTNLKVKTVGSNNWVFSCVGTITLKLNHTGVSNYGDYVLKLKKM
jgi:hypothetical protein